MIAEFATHIAVGIQYINAVAVTYILFLQHKANILKGEKSSVETIDLLFSFYLWQNISNFNIQFELIQYVTLTYMIIWHHIVAN